MVCIPDSILCDGTIPPICRLLLCIVASQADDKYCAAEISRKKLIERLGVTQHTIRRAVCLLERRGLLEVVPQTHENGAYAANIYMLKGAEII